VNTGDILTNLDLLIEDAQLPADLGDDYLTIMGDKRRLAVESWLQTRLEKAGLPVAKHVTRAKAGKIFGYDGAAYTEYADLSDRTKTAINVSSVFPTTSGALYVGFDRPFRGLYVGMAVDSVSINSLAVAYSYWDGGKWAEVSSISDGTRVNSLVPFSGGGRVTFQVPDMWESRPVNGSDYLYWLRVSVNSLTPSGFFQQVAPIVRSRLTVPAAHYALSLIYQESIASERGGWEAKADRFGKLADQELEMVLPVVRDEFDINETGAIEKPDDLNLINSINPSAGASGWTMERG
jgi:hypothetical protein